MILKLQFNLNVMIILIVMVNTDAVNINRVCLKVRYKGGIRGDHENNNKEFIDLVFIMCIN